MHRRAIVPPTLLALLTAGLLLAPATGCKKKKSDEKTTKDQAVTMAGMADMAPAKADMTPAKADMTPAKADMASAKADMAPAKADMTPAKADMDRPTARPARMAAKGLGGIGGLLASAPAPRPSGKAYTIKLDRPGKVGMRYRLVSNGHRRTRLTMNGKVVPAQTKTYSWKYEAEVTIKAVDEKGRSLKEEHKVKSFTITEGGKTRPGAAPGATVVAFVKGQKEAFTINGKPAAHQLKDILGVVCSIANRKDKPVADDIFGPGKPVQVGATWDLNKATLHADLLKGPFEKSPLKPTLKDIQGRARLIAQKTVNGVPALLIQVATRIHNLAPAMGPVKPTKGEMSMEVKGWAPVDTKAYGGGKTARMRMYVEGDMSRGDQKFHLVMRFEQVATELVTLLK